MSITAKAISKNFPHIFNLRLNVAGEEDLPLLVARAMRKTTEARKDGSTINLAGFTRAALRAHAERVLRGET